MLPIEYKTHIIDSTETFDKLVEYVSKNCPSGLMAIDSETDNVQEKIANLYGVSFAYGLKRGFYIPFRDKTGKEIWTLTYKAKIAQWLLEQAKTHQVLMHNAVYDVLVLENQLDIKIEDYVYCDTMLLKHTVDELKPHGLKDICLRDFGNWTNKPLDELKANVELNGGKALKDNIEMFKADTEILGKYSISDCILTILVYNKYIEQLKKEGLENFFFVSEVMPLLSVTVGMKRSGFTVDISHFEKLKSELTTEINKLEEELMIDIEDECYTYNKANLEEEFPVKNSGNFPKALARIAKIPLPVNQKTHKTSTAAKELDKLSKSYPQHHGFYEWVKGNADIPLTCNKYLLQARRLLFKEKYPERKYVFNLRSNKDLAYWIFDVLGYTPLEKTPKGARKLDTDLLDSIRSDNPTFNKLITYKKLEKLLGTYVDGILKLHISNKIYASFKQTGTVSGRYSCSGGINLQNLPRKKEDDDVTDPLVLKYTNAIRDGFIAPPGYKLIVGDYDQLEIRTFAALSGEKNLQQVFINGEDIYSKIAADIFKIDITHVSLKKSDSNYFGKLYPNERAKGKVTGLAIAYGCETKRLSDILNISKSEAKLIISSYLTSYPNLHKWMKTSEYEGKTQGFVKERLGRIRHLKELKSMYLLWGDKVLDYEWAAKNNSFKERRTYKVSLNTCKNFKCQSLGASLVNQAAIAIHNDIKHQNLDAHLVAQIHDELIYIVKQEQIDQLKDIIKYRAENTNKIEVPLIMEPKEGLTWMQAKS